MAYDTKLEKWEKTYNIFTVKEFDELCKNGTFINYDGFCFPMKNNLIDKSRDHKHGPWYYPFERHLLPKDCTHIIWYNR